MGLANDPCWASARPEEMRFVLLARDPDAPEVVRDWVRRRLSRLGTGSTHYNFQNLRNFSGRRLRDYIASVSTTRHGGCPASLSADDAAWMLEALDCADAMDAQRADVRAALGKTETAR